MKIKPFGKIDPDNLEEFYNGEVKIDGSSVECDVNFESESIDKSVLEELRDFVEDLEAKVEEAFQAISDDFDLGKKSEAARFYLEHHLQEFNDDEKAALFGGTEVDKATFLDCLVLQRIGIYPEDEESYAIFDIQLPEEYTNYLMAVTYDANGELTQIVMES